MVTMSLFFVLLVAVVAGFYFKRVAVGSWVLGVLFGLSLAATAWGPTILGGFQDGLNSLVQAVSGVAGA
ncbi:hypothetical protein [Myceligenerans salitolerans]|uniref:Uncharacterized protein n=1 Tax=Myceligenerans salitolerans TaxID=1230528 RepID=A0ABS3IAA8_9MICO|nr:hypothetical protein [Myceligenerans salitolerans]MBO0609373.1 hypothetical protein [Myceligenerans salitolerans]